MLNNNEYKLGSIVNLKKTHPSGTTEWKIIRVGADIKLLSVSVDNTYIMMSRQSFNRHATKVVKF